MTLLHTPQYVENLSRFGGKSRQCANPACIAADGKRTKLSVYNDDTLCSACLRNPPEPKKESPHRRHGTGRLKLTGLAQVKDERETTYGLLALECAPLCEKQGRQIITANSLSNWARAIYLAPEEDAQILASVLDCTIEELTRPPLPKDPRLRLKNFGRIKDESGKSWAQIALALGCSAPALKHWAGRRHTHTCPKRQAEKIARYFGVTLEELIGG